MVLGDERSACFALGGGVAKGLADPPGPDKEKGAACFCLLFTGEKGLEPEAASVLTARDLGMIDAVVSDFGGTERGGVEGGTIAFSGSDLVAFPSLESLL
jgi:hypothetical protein